MSRHPLRRALRAAGLTLVLASVALGQAPPPPGAPADLRELAREMAAGLQRLGNHFESEQRQTKAGRHLIQDTLELAQSVEEFRTNLRGPRPDPVQARRAYAGLDGSWHDLRGRLSAPGVATPAVEQAAARVDQVDAKLHQALGLNVPPAGFYAASAPAPTGVGETQRLAYALENRAHTFAAVAQVDLVNVPDGPALVRDAQQLAQASDAYYDSIQQGQAPDALRAAFAPVAAVADRLGPALQAPGLPARARKTWQAFAASDVLIRQHLGLPTAPQPAAVAVQPAAGPSPLVGLADRLVQDSEAFLEVFSQTSPRVPERGLFLIDAERLRDAAVAFRQQFAGSPAANQLAFAFQDVDACWQRLARRTARIAQGRIGPNIQQVQKIGATCAEIHQLLGMPGYPPEIVETTTTVVEPLPR
jgi:hypothetical protein